MENIDIGMTELAALVSLIGAGAAYLSAQGGGSDAQAPVFNIGEGFGREDDTEDTDETDASDGLVDTPGITEPDDTDPDNGDWNYDEPNDNPDSTEGWDGDDYDFGGPDSDGSTDSDDSTDDGIDWGGPVGSDQPGTGEDTGDDDPASGPSPGDTTTGGSGIGTSDPLIDYGDVAGVGDHLAGSTDEWFGRQTEGLW